MVGLLDEEDKAETFSAIIFIVVTLVVTVLCTFCLCGYITSILKVDRANTELGEVRTELERTSESLSRTTDRLEQSESVVRRCQQTASRISDIVDSSADTLGATIKNLREIEQEVEYMERMLSSYLYSVSSFDNSNNSTYSGKMK